MNITFPYFVYKGLFIRIPFKWLSHNASDLHDT